MDLLTGASRSRRAPCEIQASTAFRAADSPVSTAARARRTGHGGRAGGHTFRGEYAGTAAGHRSGRVSWFSRGFREPAGTAPMAAALSVTTRAHATDGHPDAGIRAKLPGQGLCGSLGQKPEAIWRYRVSCTR